MKRILALLILVLIISQGLVSLAQEDPCQSQVDELNKCRADDETTDSTSCQSVVDALNKCRGLSSDYTQPGVIEKITTPDDVRQL